MKTGGRKTNESQYEERMVEVFEMILYHKLSFTEFRIEASKRFNISQRSAESLYMEARKRMKEKFDQERNEILEEQLTRYYDLLKRSRDENNKRVEVEVLRDLNKIYGLNAEQKIDVTSNGEKLSINIILDNE